MNAPYWLRALLPAFALVAAPLQAEEAAVTDLDQDALPTDDGSATPAAPAPAPSFTATKETTPATIPTPVPAADAVSTVYVDKDGSLFFENKPISSEQLSKTLSERSKTGSPTPFIVAANQEAQHQMVVTTVETLKEAGVEKIGMRSLTGEEFAAATKPIAKPVINETDKTSNSLSIQLSPKQLEALRKEMEKKRRTEEEKAQERKLLQRTPNLDNKNKTLKNRKSIPKRF